MHAATALQHTAAPQSGSAAPACPAPSHDQIARRAHDIYIKKGRQPGQCKQNWHQAEQELQSQGQATGAARTCACEPSPAAHAGATPAMKTADNPAPAITSAKVATTHGGTAPAPRSARDARPPRLPERAT
jgi:hypothetical protein